MSALTTQPQENWKKEPLVWMMILIPFSAIVMGVVMITLALESESGLVVDDYYKHGKQINLLLARDARAEELQLSALLVINHNNGIKVDLSARRGFNFPPQLHLDFFHATRAGFDQKVILQQTSPGIYHGSLGQLKNGRWDVQLGNIEWRISGSLHQPGQMQLALD